MLPARILTINASPSRLRASVRCGHSASIRVPNPKPGASCGRFLKVPNQTACLPASRKTPPSGANRSHHVPAWVMG
jgi:hypothetical protein